jgi:serine protease inhibitor
LGVSSLTSLRNNAQKLFANLYYDIPTDTSNRNGDYLHSTCHISNGAFFNESLSVASDYAQALADYYYASAFRSSFDETAQQSIADWLNDNSDDFLNIDPASLDFSPATPFALFNTLYLSDVWSMTYSDVSYSGLFTTTSLGTSHAVDYMEKEQSLPYVSEARYQAVADFYQSGNYVVYMKPNAGISTTDLLEDANLMAEAVAVKNTAPSNVKLTTPKGKFSAQYSLKDTLIHLGVTDVFDAGTADLSNISAATLSVADIKQKVAVAFDRYGTAAAAETDVAGSGETSGSETTPTVDFRLDQSFVYVIMSADDIPLFVGVTNTL